MKFSESLANEAIMEWLPQYLSYKHLKSLIKRTHETDYMEVRNTDESSSSRNNIASKVRYHETYSSTDHLPHSTPIPIEAAVDTSSHNTLDIDKSTHNNTHDIPSSSSSSSSPLRRRNKSHNYNNISNSNNINNNLFDSELQSYQFINQLPNIKRSEVIFFEQLNNEIEKIDYFYKSRVLEMMQSIAIISLLANRFNKSGHALESISGRYLLDDIKNSVQNNWKDIIDTSSESHLKDKLQMICEHAYESIELIQNYQSLNRIACRKILKKFDKKTGRGLKTEYLNAISEKDFMRFEHPEIYMDYIESIYKVCFTDLDGYRARKKLQSKDLQDLKYHGSAYIFGFEIGLTLLFFSWCIWEILENNKSDRVDKVAKQYLSLILAGIGLPFVLSCYLSWTALIMDSMRINYSLIFGFNRAKCLHGYEQGTLTGLFMLLYVFFSWMCLAGWMDNSIWCLHQPWIVISIFFILIMNPLSYLHLSTRCWFLNTIYENMSCLYRRCLFRNFFIADQFMSLSGLFISLGMLIYFNFEVGYTNRYDIETTDLSEILHKPYVGFLISLPGICRALQCLRRHYDSKKFTNFVPHLANFCKYFLGLFVIILTYSYTPKHAIFVFFVIYQLYALVWDTVMDFDLIHIIDDPYKDGKYVNFIRKTCTFESYVYWIIATLNMCMRLYQIIPFWVIDSKTTSRVTLISLAILFWYIEITRRALWNILRIESEHSNNRDKLMAVNTDKTSLLYGDNGINYGESFDGSGGSNSGSDENISGSSHNGNIDIGGNSGHGSGSGSKEKRNSNASSNGDKRRNSGNKYIADDDFFDNDFIHDDEDTQYKINAMNLNSIRTQSVHVKNKGDKGNKKAGKRDSPESGSGSGDSSGEDEIELGLVLDNIPENKI